MDENLKTRFEELTTAWKSHCEEHELSSNPRDFIDCDPYRQIVALGKDILPLVREKYAGPDAFFPIFGWADVIEKITGEKPTIPEETRGKLEEIRDLYVNWLDKYLNRGNS